MYLTWRDSVNEYEICILNTDLAPSLFIKETYLDDKAAINAAEAFANGRRFEVWQGLNCIIATALPS